MTLQAIEKNRCADFGAAPEWMTLLGRSEKGGRDVRPRVEGALPSALRGSLFRNGPGLFERGGVGIQHVLDGDGLVQRLSFGDDGVRYQNAFVRTKKFVEEDEADRRLHASWSTRVSANPFDNFGGGVNHSQAGVTVYPVHDKIIARDELGPSYEIDAETLETAGAIALPEGGEDVGFKAHSKLDPETGEWIMAGTKYGRVTTAHVAIYEPNFRLKTQFSFECPRAVYIHDFIVSKSHVIFVLHPCLLSPFAFLLGMKSFTDSLVWRPQHGNLVALVSRAGGDAQFFEAPSAFMWHALNGFEDGDDIVADFIGYDEPDHFIGDNALFKALMQGRMGRAEAAGKIRRYRINARANRLREEIIDAANHEFPMLDGRCAMARHRVGYFACGGLGAFNSGLKRLDYETGAASEFDFGELVQVGEPVFAEAPGGARDKGWLIAQCLDGASETTFFAIFDAETISAGPVAKIWLDHHVPISFHGSWRGA